MYLSLGNAIHNIGNDRCMFVFLVPIIKKSHVIPPASLKTALTLKIFFAKETQKNLPIQGSCEKIEWNRNHFFATTKKEGGFFHETSLCHSAGVGLRRCFRSRPAPAHREPQLAGGPGPHRPVPSHRPAGCRWHRPSYPDLLLCFGNCPIPDTKAISPIRPRCF